MKFHHSLKAVGKNNFKLQEKTTLEECIYPRDKSINIGQYNGNIIITEDYQITTKTLEKTRNLNLTLEEENLCKIFPNSEIIKIPCHSAVNYHGYSLIKNGQKLRLKVISSDTPLIEFGQKIKEGEKLIQQVIKKKEYIFGKKIQSQTKNIQKTN